jgi:hypothetical protein
MRTHTEQALSWGALPTAALVAFVGLAFMGCNETGPTDLDRQDPATVVFKKGGKPLNQCGGTPDVGITFRDDPGDALQSDGQGPYVDGLIRAGISGNGNLILWPAANRDDSRWVNVTTTEGAFEATRRIFTNNHVNPGGDNACGLIGMTNGSTGSAVLEAELDEDGIVRYGKNCDGSLNMSPVVTTRSLGGDSWTITGASGIHCQSNGLKGKKKKLVEVGTAGPFSMSLVTI